MLRRFSLVLLLLPFISIPASTAEENFTVGGLRPVTVNLPTDISKPSPLLIMLHSASTSGAHQERYMKLGPVAKRLGMIYIAPDGTVGADGKRVWNASKACCQKSGTPIDDIAYINSLIDEIAKKVSVDQSRIYFIGHSNGAFMSIAFACATGRAAGVVSLAGAMDIDSTCATKRPFTFLQIHGVADKTIKIDGGVMNGHQYTSAAETINRIAAINKCSKSSTIPATIYKKDFDPTIKGNETTVQTLEKCAKPITYWRIARGGHSPKLPTNYAEQIIDYLKQ